MMKVVYRINRSNTVTLQVLFMLAVVGFNQIRCHKNEKMCAVCRVVVSEANWAIEQVDPNKSISGGSFRVDPEGNQPYKKEKKYARSETHIEEIFEKICDKFNYYAEMTKEDGSKHIVRTETFDHTLKELKGLNIDREAARLLKYRCDDFLEDHIEEVISLLQKDDIPSYEKAICAEETNVCSMEALSTPMETLPDAVEKEDIEDPLKDQVSAGLDEGFQTMKDDEISKEKEEL